eukprot:CAMPEP_0180534844 /NCGR_PEP_ID=MMETSP1036_2-20121128/64403_1 /TAXON_ID=632150 /ORGANISM="Azadinium spinosum, Strain 3D9" /LENGTH=81 /DNA_ID=CAMNT_0022549207 /DNA_START=314 /DNA_END=556 /DNA_ORIENTATION=+
MALKRRLQQEFQVLVCNQRLTMGKHVLGDQDVLAKLSSRPILKLETLPSDPKLGHGISQDAVKPPLIASREGDLDVVHVRS